MCAGILAGMVTGVFIGSVSAQDFSSGYKSEVSLSAGMVVSLVSEQERLVEPANEDNIDNLLGVVVSGNDSLFTVSSQESNVQVVTGGVTKMLVTDTNGEIGQGDYVTASAINGVGKKADSDHAKVVGKAQGNFADYDVRTVATQDSQRGPISVARMPVLVQIGGNPQMRVEESILPGFVQESANTLAGEPVAPARIIMAIIVIVGGLAGSMVLLYGAVSNTIISIGRNPLSDKSIYAGLFRMILVALAIILFSNAIGYAIIAA